ncbi:hypothetical protein [Haloarcula amylolytica]|uniref:Cell division control protein/MCM family protein n=1 Tax=Haloarcula amylolytica JCM 13557 TaxID=1227452 RepID=M0K0A3_9EURY|nr:cell division control protein/MCM family protein [Haloarcula amylolytica JCM 13557]
MSDDDSHSAVELVEEAADHLQTSSEHERRAKELSYQAEEELEATLAEELPDSVKVNVDAEADREGARLVVSLYDDATMETVSDVVGDDVGVGSPHPQQFIIGDDIVGEESSQRERIQNVKEIIADIEDRFDAGAPVQQVIRDARRIGMDKSEAKHEIDKLKQKGEVYEPRTDYLRTT